MTRDYLFMSGESGLTMTAAFRRDDWHHTTCAARLVERKGLLGREKLPRERLKGIIYYADVFDQDVNEANIRLLCDTGFPCWPNPFSLLQMADRHHCLALCADSDLVDHEIWQGSRHDWELLPPTRICRPPRSPN